MPTLNDDTVPYCGVLNVYAEGSPAAWGCRLIVSQDGYTDFLPDRAGPAGTDTNALFDALEAEFPISALRRKIGGLLSDGEMLTREPKHFVIFKSDKLAVHANTNGSGGYCYVIAVLRTPDSDQVETDLHSAGGA